MKPLLLITAVLEALTGLALLAAPAAVVGILLGTSLDTIGGLAVGRLAGAALLALGVACWCARGDTSSRAASGVVAAMLLYNVVAAALLVYLRAGASLTGIGLLPAAALHAAMSVWCIACLRSAPRLNAES